MARSPRSLARMGGDRDPRRARCAREGPPPFKRDHMLDEQAQLPAAGAALLNRRTGHRAVGAEYAAITRFGLEPLAATLAVVEKPAGIGRHSLTGLVPAQRTGDRRFKVHAGFLRTSA